MARTLLSEYKAYIRASRGLSKKAKIIIDKKAIEAYRTYKRRSHEQAVKVESQLKFSIMIKTTQNISTKIYLLVFIYPRFSM